VDVIDEVLGHGKHTPYKVIGYFAATIVAHLSTFRNIFTKKILILW
jgi:hypothetical protein